MSHKNEQSDAKLRNACKHVTEAWEALDRDVANQEAMDELASRLEQLRSVYADLDDLPEPRKARSL